MSSLDRVRLFDIGFDAVDLSSASSTILGWARERESRVVVTPNVNHIVQIAERPELLPVYNQADLVLADGQPLIWAARLFGTPLPERVAGSDLFPLLLRDAKTHGPLRLFIFGGREEIAKQAQRNVERELSPHPRGRHLFAAAWLRNSPFGQRAGGGGGGLRRRRPGPGSARRTATGTLVPPRARPATLRGRALPGRHRRFRGRRDTARPALDAAGRARVGVSRGARAEATGRALLQGCRVVPGTGRARGVFATPTTGLIRDLLWSSSTWSRSRSDVTSRPRRAVSQ